MLWKLVHYGNFAEWSDFSEFTVGLLFLNTKPDKHIILLCDNNSRIYLLEAHESVLELWDPLGVQSASQLLRDLGCSSSKRLNLQELSSSMEEELLNLGEVEKPPVLQAALVTYRSEVLHLRSVLESVQKERDKLRLDIGEANQRSLILAQEVDDQNARLEKSSQLQIRNLEQKHLEQLRQVQEQLGLEREQLQQQHQLGLQKLEKQLEALREDEISLRENVETKEQEVRRLEQENSALVDQLEDAKRQQNHFQKEMDTISDLRQRLAELECSSNFLLEEQYQDLLKEVRQLSLENKDLKDRNDELALRVESMYSRVLNGKNSDQHGDSEHEHTTSGISGTKRRGSCTLSLGNESWSDLESPRLGKLRRRTLDVSLQAAEEEVESESASLTDIVVEVPNMSSKESSAGEEESDEGQRTPSIDDLHMRISELEKELEEERERLKQCKEDIRRLSEKPACSTEEKGINVDDLSNLQYTDIATHLKKIFHHLRNQLVSEMGDSACPYCDKPLLLLSPPASNHNSIVNANESQLTKDGSQKTAEIEDVALLKNRVIDLETRCGDLSQLQKVMEAEYEMEIHKLKEKYANEVADLQGGGTRNLMEVIKSKSGNVKMHLAVALEELEMSLKREEQEKAKRKDLKSRCHEMEERLKADTEALNSARERTKELEFELDLAKHEASSNKLENEEMTKLRTSLEETAATLREVQTCSEVEKSELREKCRNFENSLELLRVEYEKCEDYWQGKLEEERDLYDRDRLMTNERFQALEDKIKEYEEMFARPEESESDGLSTIEERASLEKQVTDLEEECDGLRKQVEQSRADQQSLVRAVQTQLQQRLEQEKSNLEQQVQALQQKCGEYEQRLSALTRDDSIGGILPVVQDPEEVERLREQCQDLSSKLDVQARSLEEQERSWRDRMDKQRKDLQEFFSRSATTCNPKAKLQLQVGSSWSCQVEMSVLQALNSRVQQQEQRCHHLQAALKRQQQQMEKILLDTQKQHQDEVLNLEAIMRATQEMLRQQTNRYREQLEKLACSDILIKELYVENAGLVKSLQVAEQKLRTAQNHHHHLHHHCHTLSLEEKSTGGMLV